MSNNIEEDIKRLEELINNCKNSNCEKEGMCNDCYIEIEEIRAIENILNEYKKNQNIVDEIKEIIDECIPKKQNIITGKEEYTPNTNANSYLTQRILELFEREE